jgi:hypothetical protein
MRRATRFSTLARKLREQLSGGTRELAHVSACPRACSAVPLARGAGSQTARAGCISTQAAQTLGEIDLLLEEGSMAGIAVVDGTRAWLREVPQPADGPQGARDAVQQTNGEILGFFPLQAQEKVVAQGRSVLSQGM